MKWRLRYKLEGYTQWFHAVVEAPSVMLAKRKLLKEKPMAFNILKVK